MKALPTNQATEKVQKNLRISPDANQLLRLVSAYENRSEADLLEDALAIYLQHRALEWRKDLGLPIEAFDDGDTALSAAVERLTAAFGSALAGTAVPVDRAPAVGAKERLRQRRAAKAVSA
jgi:hypothetical protein